MVLIGGHCFGQNFLIVWSGTFPLTCYFIFYSEGSQAMSYEAHTVQVQVRVQVQVQVQVRGAGVVTWHGHRRRHGCGRVLRGRFFRRRRAFSSQCWWMLWTCWWISWICVGSCCDTSVLSTNRRKHPFYINEIYIKPRVSVG